MNKFTRLGVLVLLLLVAVFPAAAQDNTFGLSAADFETFTQANADSFTQTQYNFTYDVEMTLNGAGFPIDVALNGSGTVDIDGGAVSLSINGTANAAGQQTTIEGELRVIDTMLYFRATDPDSGEDTGWLSLDVSELDLDALGADDMQFTESDWDAFFDGFAQGAEIPRDQLNEDAFFEMLDALGQIDPQSFITIAPGKVEGGSLFTTSIRIADLFDAEAIEEVTRQFLIFANFDPDPSDAIIAAFNAVAASAFEDTSITLAQAVDGATGLITSTTFTLDSTIDPSDFDSPGGLISTFFSLDIQVFDYGDPAPVVAPAGAVEIPPSVLEGFTDEFGGDAIIPEPDVSPETDPGAAQGGTIGIGESATVDIPAGGAAELTLAQSGTVTITARGLDGTDTVLTVRDAGGNVIAENDDHDGSFAELDSFDSGIADLDVTGPVTIEVSEFSGSGGQAEVTVSGTVSGGAASPPKTDPGTAAEGDITIGETVTVSLADGAAELTLAQSGTVTITARGLDGTDPILTVRDAGGNVIAENDDHDGSFTDLGLFDSAIADLTVTAPVTIAVSEFGTTGGSVEVTVTGTASGGGASVPDADAGGTAVSATPVDLTCNSRAQDFEGAAGAAFSGTCPADCTGSLWGTGVYTDDSSICVAAVHAGAIPASGGDVTFVIEDGLEEYPASEQNGITSSRWGSWDRSFSFTDGTGTAAAPDADAGTGGAGTTVNTDMPNSYAFNNGVSFSFPDPYTVQTESDVVTVMMTPNQRAIIQVYETRFLFGEMDMGIDFMKSTYGQSAASTWTFDFDPADFVDTNVNGRTLSILEFEGTQTGEPVTGAVIVVPYSGGGYGYIIAYALPPAPDSFSDDALAVAASLDG